MKQNSRKFKPMMRLTKEQIKHKQEQIRRYMEASNAADGSLLDANANVSVKTVSTMGAELQKDICIQVNRQTVYDYIQREFGTKYADKYIDMIESHVLYKNDESSLTPGTPYCVAINMYPFIEDGMTKLGGESKAPKHLESFCGSFNNLIFAISSQFNGAVAAVEFLLYFHHFAKKDYGREYLKTHADMIKSKLQHVIYTLNQPAAARGYQSVFFNLSVFDRYFFESMFGHFYFPDGDHVDYDEYNEFQKFFMEWLLEERTKSLLTFPVVTEASLNENGKPKDKEWAYFCADIRSRGLSFFSFNDDTPSALASCCLTGDTIVSYYKDGEKFTTTIKDLVEHYQPSYGESKIPNEVTVDSFNVRTQELEQKPITGVLKRRITEPMYKFSINGKTITVTGDHPFTVKQIDTGEMVTIPAKTLYTHCNEYLVPCIE